MKRIALVLPLVAASLLAIATPTFAAPIVRQISEAQAQGLTGDGAQISVWPGSGTNLDFTRTGEVIQRVWLDDPSRLTLDFDGNLCGQGNSGNCDGAGASVIHLRRVTGIHFENLPETVFTLLTVVTDSTAGRKVYQFQVNYGSGDPQYATVAIAPNVSAQSSTIVTISGRSAGLLDIQRGLRSVIASQLIPSDSPVIPKIQDFLARVRNGATPQAAADAAGISLAVVSRLAEMGLPAIAQPIETSPPVPLEVANP
ncbi:hypothetical protein [Almyronema epifaneia]|uniref:Uncharacterized protein n=1 Tax=Almyronema epifaneia S1 TaxID=2991925 RepID=A0ABW6IDJ9_9CYAN